VTRIVGPARWSEPASHPQRTIWNRFCDPIKAKCKKPNRSKSGDLSGDRRNAPNCVVAPARARSRHRADWHKSTMATRSTRFGGPAPPAPLCDGRLEVWVWRGCDRHIDPTGGPNSYDKHHPGAARAFRARATARKRIDIALSAAAEWSTPTHARIAPRRAGARRIKKVRNPGPRQRRDVCVTRTRTRKQRL
jgi:hypothetical protein